MNKKSPFGTEKEFFIQLKFIKIFIFQIYFVILHSPIITMLISGLEKAICPIPRFAVGTLFKVKYNKLLKYPLLYSPRGRGQIEPDF